jgi:hypothetical protein
LVLELTRNLDSTITKKKKRIKLNHYTQKTKTNWKKRRRFYSQDFNAIRKVKDVKVHLIVFR